MGLRRRVAKLEEGGSTPPCQTKIISIYPKLKCMSFLMLCFELET